jgi:metal-sulfur cluster biosynthetic enzyme
MADTKFNRKPHDDGTFDWGIQDKNINVEDVKRELQQVYDPEIHINVHDLGLIYHCDVVDGSCKVVMTLTSPFCPVAGEMPEWVKEALLKVEGINDVEVEMCFDPTFSPEMMSELAQFSLNMYGDADDFGDYDQFEHTVEYHRFR